MNIYKIIFIWLLIVTSTYAGNGESMAYLQYDGDYWQVYINDGTGQTQKITSSQYDKSTISWFANGAKLFVCGIQAEAEIVDIETGTIKSISLPKPTVNDAVMSPDGSKILYSYIAADTVDNKLWLFDLRSNTNKPILSNMQGRQYDPKWNVAGDVFYFTTGFANKNYSIAKAIPGSNVAEVVIQNAKLNLDVDVAKDGNIAWSSNVKNSFNIWMLRDNKVKQLTNVPEADTHPSWSSKEGVIYFARVKDGISNIWQLNINGKTEAKQITNSEIGARYPVVFKGEKH